MKRYAIMLAVTATVMTLSACASGHWESENLVDRRNVRVALEHRVEADQVVDQDYNQPAEIEPALIETLLGDLYYMRPPEFFGEAEEQPVFQAGEIQRLAPAFSVALQKASSDQRIRFTSHNKGGGLIFKDQRKTSGVLFIDADNRLNLALSYINRITDYDDRVDAYGSPDPDPLTVESSENPIMAQSPYIKHHLQAGGEESPLWVEADLDELRAAAKTPPAPAAAPARQPETEKKMAPEKPEPSPDRPADNRKWEKQREGLKTKLEYLKELYEDGLISRTEYEAKKQELLNQIQ